MADEHKALGLTASRRQFGIMGAVAAIAGMAQPAAAAVNGVGKAAGRSVSIDTPYGVSSAQFFHPATGQHRGLVMWGANAAAEKTAKSLASQGWAVLLVGHGADDEHADRQITKEARAYVAWLEKQDVVASTGKAAEPTIASIGHGYKLRNVSGALSRFSFANAGQREMAAASATLFAVPDAVVPSHRTAALRDAARSRVYA